MPISVAVDDIIELKLVGNYNGSVQVNNVFHYKIASLGTGTGAPATLDAFGAGFVLGILPDILAITADVVTYTSIDVRLLDADTGALVNGETVLILPPFGDGAGSADALPPHDCTTFKYVRPNSSFRHGFKRFAGVSEDGVQDGLPTGGAISFLNALALTLQGAMPAYPLPVDEDDDPITGAAANPVVLKRVFNGDPLNPIEVAEIVNVVFSRIGTQNSRKFGVGV